ncbi:MAG TPA: zf-HC2 domain-containing protein [Blastocatellia bacterium]|nr:zf-HC2 domain-containing protein [Blastocatellia bacterium]
MSCEFDPRLSLMIDGALSPEEANDLQRHLATCRECSDRLRDFLALRSEIKSLVPENDRFAERRALTRILSGEPAPIWKRKVSVPVPAAAMLLFTFLAACGWSISSWRSQLSRTNAERVVRIQNLPKPEAGFDLARFDHDKLPVIIKVRREEPKDESKTGVNGGGAR